ncbi:DUF6520 family protein [Flavivirga spongiicola]|uniref:DUF6520 family protein n=1 Tax=Flavivirga spongiicola TaxID=421621 RepID=UPI0038CC0B76
MKRHFLKTVLPAFVFMLAIVASFSFKPAPNEAVNDVYIQMFPPAYCTLLSGPPPTDCSINNWGAECTTQINFINYDLYSRAWGLLCQDVYRLPL